MLESACTGSTSLPDHSFLCSECEFLVLSMLEGSMSLCWLRICPGTKLLCFRGGAGVEAPVLMGWCGLNGGVVYVISKAEVEKW
jgi:hypothetical protein